MATFLLVANEHQGLEETDRYERFSRYIHYANTVKDNKKLLKEFNKRQQFPALYDIHPETEQLRQTKDIRDELKMIERVNENQRAVLVAWSQEVGGWDQDRLAFYTTTTGANLEKLDGDAESVEKRVTGASSCKVDDRC